MSPRPPTPLVVDCDNALGARRGDVDDAFALAAVLASGIPVAAVASVFGNTSEASARANCRALATRTGFAGPVLAGAPGPLGASPAAGLSEAARFFVQGAGPWRLLALGPLTNLAAALRAAPDLAGRVTEVIAVGSNRTSWGRWPPWWPYEFNLTRDRLATHIVVQSAVPLTLLPLDAARRLTAAPADLAALPGPLGAHLASASRRWGWRSRCRRGRARFPVWDLVAALYALAPGLFTVERTVARCHRRGWIEYGAGARPLTVVRDFDPRALWSRFVTLLAGPAGGR